MNGSRRDRGSIRPCCCEQGLRAGPGMRSLAQDRAVRWSTVKFQVLHAQENAALAHGVLTVNTEMKTKGLPSKYCERSHLGICCVPWATRLWDSDSISSLLSLHSKIQRLFHLLKPSWRPGHRACARRWGRCGVRPIRH